MRRGIVMTAAVGLTMVLSACGGSDSSSEPAGGSTAGGEETGASQQSSGSLTVWADELRADALAEMVTTFEEDKGVDVEVVEKNFDDIREEFLAQAPTGEGPDVIVGAHDWAGELVTNGVVNPVQLGAKAEEFSEVAVNAFTYEGQTYGVPYGIENIALVRNNDIVSQAPDSFDALIEQGQEADAKYPLLLQIGEEGDAYHMYPLQSSFGAQVFKMDDSGSYVPELALGGENGEAFAEYLSSLGQAGSGVLDTAITDDVAKEAFLNGESPYMITGPWNISAFTDAGLDVSVLPIPSAGDEPAAPFVGVQGFYISSYSENAVLANEFLLNYVGTKDVQLELYKTGGRVPALKAAADALSDDPIVAGFAEAGEIGVPMPALPEMNAVWTYWGTTEADIVSGQASDPAQAWNTMVDNIKGAIEAS